MSLHADLHLHAEATSLLGVKGNDVGGKKGQKPYHVDERG